MVGFFIPGETAVVVGGVLAGLGRVEPRRHDGGGRGVRHLGDSVGLRGREAGGPVAAGAPHRSGGATAGPDSGRTMGLLERYGGPAVFLGRFVAFARAVIPGLAGMSGLRYRVFLFYNAIGRLCWGVGYTLLGYVVGVSFEHILDRDRAVVAGRRGGGGRWSPWRCAVAAEAPATTRVATRRVEFGPGGTSEDPGATARTGSPTVDRGRRRARCPGTGRRVRRTAGPHGVRRPAVSGRPRPDEEPGRRAPLAAHPTVQFEQDAVGQGLPVGLALHEGLDLVPRP